MTADVIFLSRRPAEKPKPVRQRRFRASDDPTQLMMEVQCIEGEMGGPTPYSSFLKRFCKRPDKAACIAMSALMGGARLKADDGKLYPPLTEAQRQFIAEKKAEQKEFERAYIAAWEFENALTFLSRLPDDIDVVLSKLRPGDLEEVKYHIDVAADKLKAYRAAVKKLGP